MDVEQRLLRVIERQNAHRQCLEKLTSVAIELLNDDDFTVDPSYRDITLEWDETARGGSASAAAERLTPQSCTERKRDVSYWHEMWTFVPDVAPAVNKLTSEPLIVVTADEKPLIAQRLELDWQDTFVEQAWIAQGTPGLTLPESVRRQGETPAYAEEHEVTEDFAERHHAVFFIKLFLFIFLFDLEMEYLSLLAFVFFLHVNGVFDPVLRWFRQFRRRQNAPPLDRVLRHLEERNQLTREQAAALAAPAAPSPVAPTVTPDLDTEDTSTSISQAQQHPSAPQSIGEDVQLPRMLESTTSPPLDTPQLSQEKHIFIRWFYQTVVMFFGTLMPWWKPDQTYLM